MSHCPLLTRLCRLTGFHLHPDAGFPQQAHVGGSRKGIILNLDSCYPNLTLFERTSNHRGKFIGFIRKSLAVLARRSTGSSTFIKVTFSINGMSFCSSFEGTK